MCEVPFARFKTNIHDSLPPVVHALSCCHAIHAFRIPPPRAPCCLAWPGLPCPGPPPPPAPSCERERGRQDVINSLQWMMIDVGDNCRRAFDHRHLTDRRNPAAAGRPPTGRPAGAERAPGSGRVRGRRGSGRRSGVGYGLAGRLAGTILAADVT